MKAHFNPGMPPVLHCLNQAHLLLSLRLQARGTHISSPTHANLYACFPPLASIGLGTKAREGLVVHCFRAEVPGLDRQGQNMGMNWAGMQYLRS